MESIVSTFHIDWKIILAQAINFALVVAVLYFFALKPLSKLMAERREKIEKGLNDAKEHALLLERTKNEYEAVLVKARREGEVIFEQGKKDALAKREELLAEAKKEVESLITAGKSKLEEEKKKIVEEARGEIANLALQITEKVLNEKLPSSFNEKMIKEIANI